MRKTLILVVLVFMFTGCLGQIFGPAITKSMRGFHNAGDLIASWGPPTRVMDDGYGGKVYIYVKYRGFLYPATSTTSTYVDGGIYGNQVSGAVTSQTVYSPEVMVGFDAYRMFWVDQYGRIYRWQWRGI